MKYILKSIFLFAFVVSISSCEKCLQCEYYNFEGEYMLEEKCGDTDELNAFEKEIEDSSQVNRTKYSCSNVN